MKQKKGGTAAAVIALLFAHAALCVIYRLTYFSEGFGFDKRFHGPLYYVALVIAFLLGPFIYYVVGRLFNGRGSVKAYTVTVWTIFGFAAVFGVFCLFVPSFMNTYATLNAPSYLYYGLFNGSVMYITVPAMIISAVFPALFSRMGFVKKPRTNNEIKMEEPDDEEKKAG